MTYDHPTCTCGHQIDAHLHYRPGNDCGMCSCQRYRRLAEPSLRTKALVLLALVVGTWLLFGLAIWVIGRAI